MNKLLLTILLTIPVLALSASSVSEGHWEDGTKIEWICKAGTDGAVRFRFTLTNGDVYQGQLSCGEGV